MQRICLKDFLLGEKILKIDDKDLLNQIVKVLRSKTWDEFLFFDGKTYFDFKYKIIQIEKKHVLFELTWKNEKNPEKIELTLYQAIPNKIDKIEDIIEKGTQIGYSKFVFFKAKRSQDLFISENKVERFKKIIQESWELAYRNIIPEIVFEKKLDLENISWENFYFHTQNQESNYLKNIDFSFKKYNLFVGPEWWFDEEEIDNFDKNNFKKIYLWNNILRTQTAWITTWFYFIQNTL